MAEAMLPLLIGSTLMQATTRWGAGNVAEAEAEAEAKQHELAGIQQEADRKKRLAKAMSSSIAGSGAGGVLAFEGSPLSILQESVKAEEVATERSEFESRLAAKTAITRGKVKKRAARQQAGIGLMTDVPKIAETL